MKKNLLLLLLITVGFSRANAQINGNLNYDKGNNNYNNLAPSAGNNQYNNEGGANTYQWNLNNNNRNTASTAYLANNTEVTLETNGLLNLVASDYVAMFNIIQVGETPDNTNQLMNKRISLLKSQLALIGTDSSAITVDMISFVPKYDYQVDNKIFSKTYNEVPAGFEMQKTVSVHYKNSALFDGIVSAAAAAEIYDLVKVDYFIPNLQHAMDSLRTVCLAALKKKTESYQAIGFKLDTMKRVMAENHTTVYPETRYYSYTAVCKPSMNAARKKNSSDKINEVATSASQYYMQVNYDHYDFVINPVVTQPVVQLSYSISVKYLMNEPATPKDNYFLITPYGDTKPLNVSGVNGK